MSANLNLVRSIFAAWELGDFSSTEWAHAEIQFAIADGPAPGSWKGRAGMEEDSRRHLSAWQDYRVKPEDYREIDGERVLVLFRDRGRGKMSGLDIGQMSTEPAALFHIRGGKVTRLVWYMSDRERALADLGLAPEGGSQR